MASKHMKKCYVSLDLGKLKSNQNQNEMLFHTPSDGYNNNKEK